VKERWEKRGRKGGEIGELRNIFQLKKSKEAGANKNKPGTGMEGYGRREVSTSLPPSPQTQTLRRCKILGGGGWQYSSEGPRSGATAI